MQETKHAYFSPELAQKRGTCWWLREDGTEVECTHVDLPSKHLRTDATDLGPVVRWARGMLRTSRDR